ncbi:hypothetical protein [Deinococcus malanensis]|uniref:hypothetical protein n=1 Tax=Deinococcus malanensis TaxID=1706855 RepID=UPI00166DA817|nr:hypothetical protein [Deinococcus malanensis]
MRILTFLPDGTSTRREATPRHLLMWTPLRAGTGVGELKVSVTADATRRELVVTDLLPGAASSGVLEAPAQIAWADAQGGWRLDAENLRDRRGNEIVTGSAVTYIGLGPQDLRFMATVPAIDGEASLNVAPLRAGRYRFFLQAGSLQSARVGLTARPGLRRGSFRVKRQGRVIILGPLVTVHGALVDTGTGVTATVLSAEGRSLREDVIPVVDGRARYEIPVLPPKARFIRFALFGEGVTTPLFKDSR